MFFHISLVNLLIGATIAATTFEANTQFYGFNNQSLATSPFVSKFDIPIATQCNPNGPFTIIVHGEGEDYSTPWVKALINKFLYYRGGCVFFMNYSYYSKSSYLLLYSNLSGLKNVLIKKMRQIANFSRQLCFGYGFGARLCVAAGLALETPIDRMELCDPCRQLFNNHADPKPAAKNVACINTSTDLGTSVYNCHQNFRMGQCGNSQVGAGKAPLNSHGLCPYFYTLAFSYNFVPNNFHNCSSSRLANATPNVKMGYNAVYNRTLIRGDIFIATAKYAPFIVQNGVINNNKTNLMDYIRL